MHERDSKGWQGTKPAEGSRRALIRDTIEQTFVGRVFGGNYGENDRLYLDLADAVEEALLGSGDDE
jgi:hypothetical protein